MKVNLQKFRSFSKKFIIISCLLVLLLALLSQSGYIFQKGPNSSLAQDLEPGDAIGETPIEYSYEPGEPVGETPIEFTYEPGEAIAETPITDDSQPGNQVAETPIVSDNPPQPNPPPQNPEPILQELSTNPPPAQTPDVINPTVIRSYPECAGGTGMVHDVDAMSDGSYKTSNQHFQAGACGDTSNQQVSQPQQIAPSQAGFQVAQGPATSTVIRTYSECAGNPGRVHQVDQMSDGSYRTYNEHFQSGACGDVGQFIFTTTPTVTPTPTPYITSFDSRCDDTTRIFYRRFSDGRTEDTGQRDHQSSFCGFQPSLIPFNNTIAQGAAPTFFVQTPGTGAQFTALSVSCLASPSSVRIGESMTWRVMTTGGSGSFSYRWSGEGVEGQTSQTVFTSYNTAGNRTVQVLVTDTATNNTVSAVCSTQITTSPSTPTPTPTPTSTTVVTNPQIAQCPPSTIEKSRSGNQLICEAQNRTNTTVVQSAIAQCPAGTIEKSRSGSQLVCEAQNQVAVVTSTPTPTPNQVQTTIVTAVQPVQCPSGTIEKSRTSAEIICERQVAAANTTNNNIVVNPQAAQTKESITVLSQAPAPSVKELPKTGLPLAAVGMASLTPLGLRVKRLLGSRAQEESANDLWIEKQLKQ